MNLFSDKLKEVFLSVMPVTLIVILLNFFMIPMGSDLMWKFSLGAICILFGLTFFLIGVELGITPLGEALGSALTKRNKVWIVVVGGLVLGFFISFAEPGLMVLANQIDWITQGGISSTKILLVVSVGIAVMIVLGFMRILYNLPLYIILNISYLLVLGLSFFTSPEFLAIAFDASGATTGILAVPFILSLSLGITMTKKDSKASEKDSFGLVAIASVGAIIAVMLLDILTKGQSHSGNLVPKEVESVPIYMTFFKIMPEAFRDSLIALSPLVMIFIILCVVTNAIGPSERRRIAFGFFYALIGMFLFFVGANAGFMNIGSLLGRYLAIFGSPFSLIALGFILGVVTILAEPAVHVLTHQIEEVTAGYVSKRAVLIALSTGVGIAVALSMLRIIDSNIQLWHYLLPGYAFALGLTFVVPKLFIGIAFDAGGVATGPMTATFILAFTHGVADSYSGANLLSDGFGMIAMVAMMPIITLQLLGLVFKLKTKKKVVDNHGE